MIGTLLVVAAGGVAPAAAATGDIGFQDQSYAPLGGSPTGTKPESRLWFNNGWWGIMFNTSASSHDIYKLDWASGRWSDTGVAVDSRDSTRSDTLWDAASNKLYVASHVYSTSGQPTTPGSTGRLYRYTYNPIAGTYSLDPGFPVNVNSAKTETLVIDKDSTGTLWATWTQGSRVYVNHSLGGNDASWGTPYIVPGGGTSLTSDDISSLIHFGSTHIGLMWSNQVDHHFYFAVHNDGAGDSTWSSGAVTAAAYTSDDHVNLKTDSAGRVYAAVKSGETAKSATLTALLVRATNGDWSSVTFGTAADSHTRPIVVLDDQIGVIHMFATCPQPPSKSGQAGGDICEKTALMSNPVFPPGIGTTVIRQAGVPKMNDATSTKQNVTSASGLVVLANNATSKTYWHMQETLPAAPAAPPSGGNQKNTGGTSKSKARARARRQIHLRVSPHRARAGRRVLFTFSATLIRAHKRIPVRQATIRFAGHRAHTNRKGHARIKAKLRHGHRYRAFATKRGLIRGKAIVRSP